MAINPETQYPGKIAPSTPDYPYGAARNITNPGDGTGTPWEAALVNDLFGFQQALLAAAGIVPSATPDKVGASQYLSAVMALSGGTFKTLADALAATHLKEGNAVGLAERLAGFGGGAVWDVVLTSSVTPDGYGIVQSTGTPTLSLVLRKEAVNTWKQYGAKGDGVQDDTAAIQAALDAKGTLMIDDSTYLLTDRVNVPSDTNLVFAGTNINITSVGANGEEGAINIANASSVTVTGKATLTGNNVVCSGISATDSDNVHISGITAINFDWSGVLFGASTNCTATDCHADQCGGTMLGGMFSIGRKAGVPSSDIHISHCTTKNSVAKGFATSYSNRTSFTNCVSTLHTQDGFYMGDEADNAVFLNCYAESQSDGNACKVSRGGSGGRIENCVFKKTNSGVGEGLRIQGANDLVVISSYIEKVGGIALLASPHPSTLTDVNNVKIIGCTVRTDTSGGIRITDDSLGASLNIGDVTVQNCDIRATGASTSIGVYALGASKVNITNNRIEGFQDGIRNGAGSAPAITDLDITDNHIEDISASCIVLDPVDRLAVNNNTVIGKGNGITPNGIFISNSVSSSNCIGNTVKDCTDGIRVISTSLWINLTNNIVSGCNIGIRQDNEIGATVANDVANNTTPLSNPTLTNGYVSFNSP
ncbi:polygalacturonase [Oceanospirillum phage vB_OsaM_PD0307]|nr:polygalacturonase [Oceanospirillum phage vB_OsaM_PD0307]